MKTTITKDQDGNITFSTEQAPIVIALAEVQAQREAAATDVQNRTSQIADITTLQQASQTIVDRLDSLLSSSDALNQPDAPSSIEVDI